MYTIYICVCSYPGGSDGKESTCNAGNVGSIPGSGKSPGEGNGNPLQYSRLGNPTDIGAWQAAVHGVTKSQTRLSTWPIYVCPKRTVLNILFGNMFSQKYTNVYSILNYIYLYNYICIYDNFDTIYFFYMNWTILSYFPNLLLVGLKFII